MKLETPTEVSISFRLPFLYRKLYLKVFQYFRFVHCFYAGNAKRDFYCILQISYRVIVDGLVVLSLFSLLLPDHSQTNLNFSLYPFPNPSISQLGKVMDSFLRNATFVIDITAVAHFLGH